MEGKGEESLNKEFDFRWWHCGSQGGGSSNNELDAGIVKGLGGESVNKEIDFRF